MTDQILYLYGGDRPWDSSLWTAQDDRVRGGSSTSSLLTLSPERARFLGHLDTSTLGGAGFASQRTLYPLDEDLRGYAGIVISAKRGDGKRYLMTLKDSIPGKRPDGRDESGVSWEADFVVESSGEEDGDEDGWMDVVLPWSEFEATYRGRPKKDAKPLDLGNIQRVGLMMRSFFGEQEGDFSVDFKSIAAFKDGANLKARNPESTSPRPNSQSRPGGHAATGDEWEDDDDLRKETPGPQRRRSSSWWKVLTCGLL